MWIVCFCVSPIARILQKNNITPALYTKNNISSKLVNNKYGKIDTMSKSGVYELSCGGCDAFYVGQTCRSFWSLYKEHEYALKRLNRSDSSNYISTSAFADHLHETNHSASPNNTTPLPLELKGQRLDLLESAEIKLAITNNKNILNNQLDIKKQLIAKQ